MKIVTIIEKGTDGNWGAYAPDLPVAVIASSEAEARSLIHEALEIYFADLREAGRALPTLSSAVQEIEIQ